MNYPHIFSPISIGNVRLKSRLTHAKSGGTLDGTAYQFERATRYYRAVARNGAALVCMPVGDWPDCEGKRSPLTSVHMEQPDIQCGFSKMIDTIHEEDTLCFASLMNIEPQDLSICQLDHWDFHFKGDYNPNFKNKPEISSERIKGMIHDFVFQCSELQKIGFDGVTFYMCYHASILANAIDPVLNQRSDCWGGNTLVERARLPLEIFRQIKDTCGQDFLIEIQTSAEEESPGYDLDYWLDFCELCQGLVDIFQIRGWDGSSTHVTGFNSTKENPPNLKYAEAFKRRGIHGLTAPVGGFGDPDMMEAFLRDGRTDLIAMARPYIADLDMAKKMKEGRPEDITPCLRCMGKCDFPTCAVNPKYALLKIPNLFLPVRNIKKVAVLGGGASGMRAAMAARERGHHVVLFEQNQELGGQARFARHAAFKWNMCDYLDWMIRQVNASGTEIRVNTTATPEEVAAEGFDAIICALGSVPKSIPVHGADQDYVWTIDQMIEDRLGLGHTVVVIGGGHSGCEAALCLAQSGHDVTLLTRTQEVYTDNDHCVYGEIQAYLNEPHLHVVEFATTTRIDADRVYANVQKNAFKRELVFPTVGEMIRKADKSPIEKIPGFIYPEYPNVPEMIMNEMLLTEDDGPHGFPHPKLDPPPEVVPIYEAREFPCDCVLVSGGRVSRKSDAATFAGCAPEIYVIGDNARPGSLQECTLTAYAAAMAIGQ